MKKQMSLRKQAQLAPKFVLITKQYGFEMFIADADKINMPVTNEKSEALEFSVGFDSEETKLSYYKALTGYELEIMYL